MEKKDRGEKEKRGSKQGFRERGQLAGARRFTALVSPVVDCSIHLFLKS